MNKGGNTCIQLKNWDKSARQWCWKVEDSNFRENEKLGKRFCGQHQCAEQQRLLVPIISQFLPPFQHLSPFQIHTTTFQLANISKVYKNIQQFKKMNSVIILQKIRRRKKGGIDSTQICSPPKACKPGYCITLAYLSLNSLLHVSSKISWFLLDIAQGDPLYFFETLRYQCQQYRLGIFVQ